MNDMEKEGKILIGRLILSIVILVLAVFLPLDNLLFLKISLFVLAYIICSYDVIIEAFEKIFHGEFFEEEFLMFLASIGAFVIAEYLEAVLIMLLYQIGEFLSDYAVDKAKDSIKSLVEIKPDKAFVIRNGETVCTDPNEVNVGEIIEVKPGERIPLDGIVIEGESLLDTKAITGESLPKEIIKGDFVASGCINQSGVLKISVQKKYEDSTVNRIIKMVEESQEKKAKQEKFITKFSKIYTPIVVVIALLLFLVPSIITGMWNSWLYKAISVLVVCCPCALVISIPLSYFGGIGRASKSGILVKGSNYLDALTKCNTVVFDKTGTLTKGNFKVSNIVSYSLDKEELLKYAAICEHYSSHPIAEAIKVMCNVEFKENDLTDYKEISGYGISCKYQGKPVLVGNKKHILNNNIDIKENTNETGTVAYVCVDNKLEGYIVISDEIKPEAKTVIDKLKKMGIKTVMLTGDKKEAAEIVSKELGIDETYSELLPQDKTNVLSNIKDKIEKGGKVVFVGDGINDAPVLSLADVGIAMGVMGSDAAIEASDIVIMDDNLLKIEESIRIAKKTKKIALENIIFSLLVKFVIIILGALGLTKIGVAVFGDVGVLLLCTLNATRTLRKKV